MRNGGSAPHHLLKFQACGYSAPQLLVSFGQGLNHALLYRFVNVDKIRNEIINQMFLVHLTEGKVSLPSLCEIIRFAYLPASDFSLKPV
jgi:hypothetical protein